MTNSHREGTSYNWYKPFIPFSTWPAISGKGIFRFDFEAGLIGAVLAFPQAIALATLAGMPPEYGVYASIIPVIIAVIWGSSWHLLSGPNTAVCVLIAATVTPLAAQGSELYIGYVLLLTLLVGLVQILMGTLRLGFALDFISNTVVVAIIQAVALVIIISSVGNLLGIDTASGSNLGQRLYQILANFDEMNFHLLAVGGITLVLGVLGKRWWRRYALIIAIAAGTLLGYFMNIQLGGEDKTGIKILGDLPLTLSPFSIPAFELGNFQIYQSFAGSALAIAFLGLMQTIVISRMLAEKSKQQIDINREITGQGISNMVAPFVSAFAGSGSFNRSAANYQAGARTPMAVIYGAVLLGLFVFVGDTLIGLLPEASIAAVLLLVGHSLIDGKAIRRAFLSTEESAIFLTTFTVSLILGLNTGVFSGVFLSLAIYLWKTSRPNLGISDYYARNGNLVKKVTIDGNLFFGSVPGVERLLPLPVADRKEREILLINTDHITYIDTAGVELIVKTIVAWREADRDGYLYVTRESIAHALEKTGLLNELGEETVIHRDLNHPMKHILNPYMATAKEREQRVHTATEQEEEDVNNLAQRLRSTPLFGPVPVRQLAALLEQSPIRDAEAGDIIVNTDNPLDNHLILLNGELEAQTTWKVPGSPHEKSHTWSVSPNEEQGQLAVITAASRKLRVRAVTDVRYLLLDADNIDELLGWSQQLSQAVASDEQLGEQIALVRQVGVFHHLPLEHVQRAFDRMESLEFEAGDVVIREGDEGDSYYLVEEGKAEVIRTDPFTDETRTVDHMGPGDTFGEEALLQGGYRNATIRMQTPGRMLRLTRDDFAELVQPSMVSEIGAEEAKLLIENGTVSLLDCRYDMEYEDSRIPGAKLMPLHVLRFRVQDLDPDSKYIVYCRSGRRSKAAAFLLQERNFNATSLAGGIKEWPYDVEVEPLLSTADN